MKEQELMVGNWVIDCDDDNRIIQIKDGDDISFHDCYTPIPLNEEWLKGFGFWFSDNKLAYVKEIDSDGGSFLDIIVELEGFYSNADIGSGLKVETVSLERFYTGGVRIEYINLSDRIESVHQLQNLCFALTGKELELKDNK